MAYRFHLDEPVGRGVRRLAAELLDATLADLDAPVPARGAAAHRDAVVHRARQRAKLLRALLRLVRPALGPRYDTANARVRDAARLLAPARDAAVLVGTYDALLQHAATPRRPFAPIRRALTRRRATEADLDATLAAFRAETARTRRAFRTLPVDGDGFEALEDGLRTTYRRGRSALALARRSPTDERLHTWRRHVKDHGAHVALLREAWPPVLLARRRELAALGEVLGAEHDLAVLGALLRGAPQGFGRDGAKGDFLALLDRRRAALQAQAFPLGARLFAERPGALAARLGAYWAAWHDEPRAERAGG